MLHYPVHLVLYAHQWIRKKITHSSVAKKRTNLTGVQRLSALSSRVFSVLHYTSYMQDNWPPMTS